MKKSNKSRLLGFCLCVFIFSGLSCSRIKPIFFLENDESTTTSLVPWSLDSVELSKKYVKLDAPSFSKKPWMYFADQDYGVRKDDFGDGRFQSLRTGGVHSGIDYLLPDGTDLISPCNGLYFAGNDPGYGLWVQLVCSLNVTNQVFYVSLLFAHLKSIELKDLNAAKSKGGLMIEMGWRLGKSGRSGNAAKPGILPHLHLETAFHFDLASAVAERHSKIPYTSPNLAAKVVLETLKKECYVDGFVKGWDLAVGSRLDPYLIFRCLSKKIPKIAHIGNNTLGLKWDSIYGQGRD